MGDEVASPAVPWLDLVTAISTSVAAFAAVIAIVVSAWLVTRDRRRQVVRDRLEDATALMAAFEEDQGMSVLQWITEDGPDPVEIDPLERSRTKAQLQALLRASAEALPITRGTYLRHIPFGADDPAEISYLSEAPMIGNPETDDDQIMKMRAEMVGDIERLRKHLEGKHWRPPTWNGRALTDGDTG